MKAILHVIEYDFKNFFRYRWFIIGLITMNLADLFISAIVFTQMTSIVNYFQFFAPGLAVVGLFASAFMIGREINMEVRREIHHYLLSLPMTRTELAIGRVIAGGLRGMLYMTPLLITNFIVLRFPTLPQLLLILLTLLLLAIGISGVSISIAVSTTSFEKFVTARGVVYYMMFFCSSVFYPLSVIQVLSTKRLDFLVVFAQVNRPPFFFSKLAISGGLDFLVVFAQVNPLTNGADMIRSFLLPESSGCVFSPLMLLNVAIFSVIFAFIATFAYRKMLQRH